MKAIGDVGAGHTLGRYELLAPIARGGMAVVWAARMKGSRGFQKLVAIKSMLPSLTDDDGTFEEMFLAESQLAAQIRHPHVAEVLDLGEQDGVHFIVMEWVDGEPLGTIHKVSREQNVQVPIAITTRIGLNVAQALHAAHELKSQVTGETYGLVHRDVSPQNILITFDGVVKVVDFGVAKATHAAHGGKTAVGQMKGKVTYMAPEQARGEPIDRRADIFALGIVLYQLVTNRHPFKGETPLKTLDKILDAKPVVPPITYTPTCHPALNAAIVRALEKDKRKRYSTMSEMAEVLETALSKMISRGGDLGPWVKGLVGDRGEMRRETIRDALRIADDRKDRATVPQLQQALAAAAPKGAAEDRSETPGASSISTPGEVSRPSEPSAPAAPIAKAAPPAPPRQMKTEPMPPRPTNAEPLPLELAKTEELPVVPPAPPEAPRPLQKRPPAETLNDPSLANIAIGATAPPSEPPDLAKDAAVATKEPGQHRAESRARDQGRRRGQRKRRGGAARHIGSARRAIQPPRAAKRERATFDARRAAGARCPRSSPSSDARRAAPGSRSSCSCCSAAGLRWPPSPSRARSIGSTPLRGQVPPAPGASAEPCARERAGTAHRDGAPVRIRGTQRGTERVRPARGRRARSPERGAERERVCQGEVCAGPRLAEADADSNRAAAAPAPRGADALRSARLVTSRRIAAPAFRTSLLDREPPAVGGADEEPRHRAPAWRWPSCSTTGMTSAYSIGCLSFSPAGTVFDSRTLTSTILPSLPCPRGPGRRRSSPRRRRSRRDRSPGSKARPSRHSSGSRPARGAFGHGMYIAAVPVTVT